MKPKLLVSIIGIVACLITAGFLNVSAETYGDLTYRITEEQVVITDCNHSVTTVTIPSEINGYPVTTIADSAFKHCSKLSSVIIPGSITCIGPFAFSKCSVLTDITIPDEVTGIYSYAFYDTAYFNNPDNWENGLLYIGNHLVSAKESVTTAQLKPGTKTIAAGTFSSSSLTDITMPDSITYIGAEAFYGCNMEHITLPSGIKHITESAFSGCNMTSVTLPDGVIAIGNRAFERCASLSEIIIPDTVESIGHLAFANTGIKKIAISANVKNIAYNALDTKSITEISVSEDNPNYKSSDGVLFDKQQSILINYPSGKTDEHYIIPSSVTVIGEWAFNACRNLKSITLSEGATEIKSNAFSGCVNLNTIIIPASVTTFCENLFLACENLTVFCQDGSPAHKYTSENNINSKPLITVSAEGKNVVFDVPPQIINDRTMIPLRAVSEALGAEVLWDESTKTTTVTKKDTTIKMTIGTEIFIRNSEPVTLDSPAVIVDSRTLVPLRAVAEAFGYEVCWNDDSKTVTIN